MIRRRAALAAIIAVFTVLLCLPAASAQQPAAPVPLYPGAVPRSFEEQALPPPAVPRAAAPAAGPQSSPLAAAPADAAPPVAMSGPAERTFCEQPVAVRLAETDRLPPPYRGFIGIWSDAAWTPQLCAALIVENVSADGTATILYVFGPTAPNPGAARGVLNGTGVIRDGELRFDNSDGSQFAFRPSYADLLGRLTTPQGQSYGATFKRAF